MTATGDSIGRIARRPLRDEVYELVLERITSGALAPGGRVSDVQLAQALGVSRTPVREALLALARQGFVEVDHHRGFSIAPLRRDEVRELYPLVWALEGLGIELSAPFPRERAERLRALAENPPPDTPPLELLDRDVLWHAILVEGADNRRLQQTLSELKTALRRYEIRFMNERDDVLASAAEHRVIAEALAAGRGAEAARALEAHWRRGQAILLQRS